MLILLPVSLTSLAMITSALFPGTSHGILSSLLWLSDSSSSMYPIFFIPYGRLWLQIFFPILRTAFLFHLGFLCCANAFKVNQSCFLSFGSFSLFWAHLVELMLQHVPPILPSKLHSIRPTFRSLSSLKFIFVYGLRDILISFSFSLLMHVHALLHSGFLLFSF